MPHVPVTLQRHAKARGYFAHARFTGRTDEAIMSTLAHEMAHVWQQSYGTPARRSYHDRLWVIKTLLANGIRRLAPDRLRPEIPLINID